MDRQDVLKRLLYPKCKTAIEFQFDNLIVNPMLSYITVQDIAQLNKIATSLKYSSKPKEKYAMIDKIMTNRGFKKMASGTNRVTYRCLNDYRIVLKIAIDKVGLSDNGNEYRNQHLLKPFVTKCFEVSPCGTVGLFERVVPITSREEFVNISDDIFDLINNLIGKYVLEDIGEKFYMNYGLREGFGPVLLDYPYVFELDGRKLICNVPEPMEPKGYCGGEIDYDLGYNDLRCRKCGKRYLATELKSDIKSDKPKIIIEGDDIIMRCVLKRGDEVVSKLNSEEAVATNTIKSKRDFVNLKAQISERAEEKEEVIKPEIKTSDEVQLRARLRGTPTSKDIDAEAREQEAKVASISETIKVDLSSTPEVESKPEEVSGFSGRLSEETNKEFEESFIAKKESEPVKENHRRGMYSTKGSKSFNGVITYKGEIWDVDQNKIVGYSVEEYKRAINESSSTDDNNEVIVTGKNLLPERALAVVEEEHVEPVVVPYVDTTKEFKGNENYRTTDIVAPIENHFSNANVTKEEKVEEVTAEVVEEAVVEEKKEIPELIIHMRDEVEEEYETVYSSDEEYDPEYSGDDEDSDDDSDSKIDLY